MIKKLFLAMVLFTVVATVVGISYYRQYQSFLKTSVFVNNTIIDIKKGQSFREFTKLVKNNGANGEDWQWRLFARIQKVDQWLRVGEFPIDAGETPLQMMKKIKANQVLTYNFTIVEGLNWRELKDRLVTDTHLLHTLNDINDAQLLQQLDSDKETPEGLFLPETYQYVGGDSDLDILIRAHEALEQALQEQWQQRKDNLPYRNPYQLLTMASIVEKETSQAQEREIIAGVFVRRLQMNMRLQTDPTVIYGLGLSYDGDIKSRDLKTDTPYNTYTRSGLPPTPIAMASLESIAASANPEDGKSLYFVANNRGGHFFSDTYEQHQQAVKDYLKGKKL
jgi:UPF0755 protein